MAPTSYMWPVVDRNVVMLCTPLLWLPWVQFLQL